MCCLESRFMSFRVTLANNEKIRFDLIRVEYVIVFVPTVTGLSARAQTWKHPCYSPFLPYPFPVDEEPDYSLEQQ